MVRLQKLWPLYARLLERVRPYRFRLAAGIVCGALYGATNGTLLYVIRKVWAGVFETGSGELGWAALFSLAALLPLVMLARGALDFLGAYLMNWVGLHTVMDMRVALFGHLQAHSLDYFSEKNTGELISRLTNDVNIVQQAISSVIEDLIKQPISLLCVMGYLLYTDWRLTAASLLLFPVCLAPIIIFGRNTRQASRAAQERTASLTVVLHEALTGMRVVKAFHMEAREAEDFRKLCYSLFRQRMRVVRARALSSPMIEVVAGLGAAVVFVYAYRAHLEASVLISVAVGLFLMYDPVKKITRVHLQIQESLSAAERIFQVLDSVPTVQEKPGAVVLAPLRRSIRFDHVSFKYAATETSQRKEAVLDDVNLEIPAGSLVAFVGASGAGKTTLFNLVPRFYDPTAGAVRIDGVDIREVTFESLRAQIGLVAQETFLFNDTVGNNILYGKPGATRDEMIAAARQAHAHDFIMQMPQQYDTPVGESGIMISGGQRQRVAIARAILKNPPILLLDEATSALDTESERAVQAALDQLMADEQRRKQLTMLVIAHRLSTVQHADRIVVLEHGRVVEQGTHKELLDRGKVYRRLYELQFNE